jgi:hypothetical protein
MFERSTRITESDRKLQKKRTFKMNNVELFVKFKNGRNRGNISEIRAKRASHQFIRKRREGGRAGGYWRER